MSDLERAKGILSAGDNTCVLCRGDTVYSSVKRGVAPVLEWIGEGLDLKGFSAADKIVGKGAAFLFVLAGIKVVYAPVMSESAVGVFTHFDISFQCDRVITKINSRDGTGTCPMELALGEIEEPETALTVMRQTVEALRSR